MVYILAGYNRSMEMTLTLNPVKIYGIYNTFTKANLEQEKMSGHIIKPANITENFKESTIRINNNSMIGINNLCTWIIELQNGNYFSGVTLGPQSGNFLIENEHKLCN